MNVAFRGSRGTDPDELRVGAHRFHVATAGIPHRGTQPADQLVNDRADRTSIGDSALDTFRHQFPAVTLNLLKVTIARTVHVVHRTHRTHAAV